MEFVIHVNKEVTPNVYSRVGEDLFCYVPRFAFVV